MRDMQKTMLAAVLMASAALAVLLSVATADASMGLNDALTGAKAESSRPFDGTLRSAEPGAVSAGAAQAGKKEFFLKAWTRRNPQDGLLKSAGKGLLSPLVAPPIVGVQMAVGVVKSSFSSLTGDMDRERLKGVVGVAAIGLAGLIVLPVGAMAFLAGAIGGVGAGLAGLVMGGVNGDLWDCDFS